MDEKKVREAIYCMKASIGETMCEECVNYYKCDHTKMDDMMRVAIEALEKQLPENTGVIDTLPETCTACHFWWGSMDQPGGMCEITGDETDTESGVWDERRMDNCPIEELEENMREILFKAKKKDNGEWAEGLPGYDINGNITELEVYKKIGDCRIYEIDPDTLCQYTGLTDKNGEKIWENDILKAHLDEDYPQDITYTKIIWNECRFCTNENHSIDIETLGKWDAEHYEVCGNIFDNPDLLEVE